MSFDEYIYARFIRYFRAGRKTDEAVLQRRATLDELKPRLTILARALTGESIEIYEAEKEGGYKDLNFFLPAQMAIFPEKEINVSFYLFRTLYLSVQRNLGLNWKSDEADTSKSLEKAIETSKVVLKELEHDFPVSAEIHKQLLDYLELESLDKAGLSWLYGKWMTESRTQSAEMEKARLGNARTTQSVNPKTTLKARATEEIVHLQIDKKMQEDYVMTHNFEKVETAEEFDGVWRDFDGSDQLEDHKDALDELNMKFMVRSDEMVHSVYQSDFTENTNIAEMAASDDLKCITYDEWDYKKKAYKKDFCKVYPAFPQKTNPGYSRDVIATHAQTLVMMRKMLANVSNRYRQVRFQTEGNEFDMDAVTDMYVDLHHRTTPSDKLYYNSRKTEKDISMLLLLDNSLSTDSYAAGNRVIDVEKQVSILFCEILNEYNIDFSIASFYSHTRNNTSYVTLKGFAENWNVGKGRIGAMEPAGFTRIGASIRHAGAQLASRQAKSKWLLLISDGKPNDFDKYEGKYGIHDVKQALRELKDVDINAFALAIEAQARYYLPQMFGQNHYQILTEPNEMLAAMVKLYEKIKRY
jgi:nitric oxide reductase NorD protein